MADHMRWGILGNATIGRKCVIPAIQKSRNGRVHALGTQSPADVGKVALANGVQHVYDSYEAVIHDTAVEAVYIPLPNHLHHPWTVKALQAGKHVLCEKPLACNRQEAQDMVAVARQTKLLLMEAFMYRFHPRSERIKQMVNDGTIGAPCLVRSAFCFHLGEDVLADGDNPRLKAEMGGGALLDVGCYGVSLARWLMDAEPTQVQAQAVYHDSGVDIHCVGSLQFPAGCLATIEASFISALQQTYMVVGSEGVIELPHDAFIPWENDAVYTVRGREEETGKTYTIPGIDEYQLMVEHFTDAVLQHTELKFSPEDSLCNMRVLDALAEAAQFGKTVIL